MERETPQGRLNTSDSELDYSTLKGGVWDYFRNKYPDRLETFWNIKTIMRDSREGLADEDALDSYLLENPELDELLSDRISDLGNKSALKLLFDEVETDIKFPHLAKRPGIKNIAA